MDFEWQTEADAVPDLSLEVAEERGRWNWRPGLTAILIIILVIAAPFYFLRQRVVEQETTVTEAIISTHQLLTAAIDRQDEELFRLALWLQDPDWVTDQTSLLATGLHFERQDLGLAPAGTEPEVSGVQLSPDLSQAEVVSRRSYTVEENGRTETVALEFTAVYRLAQRRWQLAPASADFWGERQTVYTERLVLTYPQRDEDVALQLASDLDALLNEVCSRFQDLNCPPGQFLQIHLDAGFHNLNQLVDARFLLQQGGREVTLPAPTLLGIPADDVAYRVLYRWYAGQVISVVVADLVEWPCCDQILFFQALVHKQLSQLGLRPWPLDAGQYQQLVQDSPQILLLARQWPWVAPMPAFLAAERLLLYAFVDFSLDAAPQRSIVERQRHLVYSQDFTDWARYAVDSSESLLEIERAWLRFIMDQPALASSPVNVTLPDQELYLACWLPPDAETDEQLRPVEILAYEPASERWRSGPRLTLDPVGGRSSRTNTPARWVTAVPLPHARNHFLYVDSHVEAGRQVQLFEWRGDKAHPLFDPPAMVTASRLQEFTGLMDAAAEKLVFRDQPSAAGQFDFYLLDTNRCRDGECRLRRLPGRPTWSPDGAHTLLVRDVLRVDWRQQVELLRGDEWGGNPAPVAEGYAPFWVDNERYGFAQRRPAPAIWVASVSDDRPQLWLELVAFESMLSDEARVDNWAVRQVSVHPSDPDWLFLMVQARRSHLISFHRGTGERRVHLSSDTEGMAGLFYFHLSPDGRWLVVLWGATAPGQGVRELEFIDLYAQTPARMVQGMGDLLYADAHHWSPDGGWFLTFSHRLLTLYAPGADARHDQFLDHSCFFASWPP